MRGVGADDNPPARASGEGLLIYFWVVGAADKIVDGDVEVFS